MTSPSDRNGPDDALLLHAYLDGEMDPKNALEMERRIASDPALSRERDRIQALQRLLREALPREPEPPGLRARIERAVGMRRAPVPRPSWAALAASVAAAVIVSGSSTWLLLDRSTASPAADMVVAAHVRGLMSPNMTDVASSETHTVKPWFNGRIPRAVRVIDLAEAGFPLAGGRIDVIGRDPGPTLVYRRRKHVISLTATPAPGQADRTPVQDSIAGYNVVTWTERGVEYWAVSDLNAAELGEFAERFRAG